MRNRRLGFVVSSLLFLSAFSPLARATVWYVASNGTGSGSSWGNAAGNLQMIINGATSGDEVWVKTGTYTPGSSRSDSFSLKNGVSVYGRFEGDETSRSERDPKTFVTTLSGDIGTAGTATDNCYTVVKAGSGVGSSTVLDGFTITGGYADGGTVATASGGGFRASAGGSPTIANCIFTANYAGAGGGAYATGTSTKPIFDRCRFIGNTGGGGGGFAGALGSKSMLLNCLFLGNYTTAYSGGGAWMSASGSTAFTNCTFVHNSCAGDPEDFGGGGLALDGSDCKITNSIFWGNTDLGSDMEDAQIYRSTSTPTVTYSIIEGCQIANSGSICYGIFSNSGSDPKFIAPLGKDGVAGTENDDLRLSIASPAIDACNNDADIDDATGGTQALKDSAYNAFTLRGNARFGGEVFKVDSGAPGSDPDYCDIGAHERGSLETLFVNQFTSCSGPVCEGTTWGTAKSTLQAGLALADGEYVTTIIVAAGTYYPDALSPNDRSAAFVIPHAVEVYGHFLSSDDYFEDRDLSVLGGGSRQTILSGDITQNDATCSSGTCSGTCGGTWMSNAGFCSRRDNDEDNSYHVVLFKEPGMTAVLDGFTIKGGMADFPEGNLPGECNHDSGDDDNGFWNDGCDADIDCGTGGTCDLRRRVRGAGIEIHPFGNGVCETSRHIACDVDNTCPGEEECDFVEELMESRVTVRNCTIKENSAVNHGGGVDDHGSDSVFENCRFINNYAGRQPDSTSTAATDGRGGAFYTAHGSALVEDCIFENNAVNGGIDNGGAYYADHDSTSIVRDCDFTENEANDGGALYANFSGGEGIITVEDSSFVTNYAVHGGGAMWLTGPGDGTIIRGSLFRSNEVTTLGSTQQSQADNGGGAVYVAQNANGISYGRFEQCKFLKNTSAHYGGAIWVDSPSDLFAITDCEFVGNVGEAGGAYFVIGSNEEQTPHSVINCDFLDNRASSGAQFFLGGAIATNGGGLDAVGCKFIMNHAVMGGGAISNSSSGTAYEMTSTNSLFVGNTTDGNGGAIHNIGYSNVITIDNCTIAENSAAGLGGGAVLQQFTGTSQLHIRNSILWGNSEDGVVSELAQANSNSSPLPDIEYSIVEDCSTGSGGYCNVSGDENLGDAVGFDVDFVGETPGTWEVNGGTDDTVSYNSGLHQTTFTDYSASFGSLAGLVFKPNHTDHADVYTLIVSNTSTTITVWGEFSSGYLVNGKTYQIRDYRLDECSPAIDSGNDASGYLARDVWDLDGDSSTSEAVPYDLDGNAREYNDTGVSDTGSDTGGNVSSAINDRGAYERQTNSSGCP